MAANSKKLGLLATSLVLGALSLPAFGQADAGGQPANPQPAAGQPADAGAGAGGGAGAANQGGNGGGGGGRFDPTQMRQRMMDRLKDMLGSSDDEFKALQPKIEAVLTDLRDVQGSGMRAMFAGGRGGRNGGGNNGGGNGGGDQATTPLQEKIKDLQTTLDNKDATPDDIKAKLQAVRDARTAAKAELDKARGELKDLLTARQEAVLVELGLLE